MRIKCLPQLIGCAVFVFCLMPVGKLLADDAANTAGAASAASAADSADAETEGKGTAEQVEPTEPESIGLQGRPRWEFGIGGGYFEGFDYPGSTDSNRRGFGLPFFVYRSKRFRLGGGGVSAVSIEEPRFKLDWSVAASLNSSNEENSARAGMEDLDFLFELGPQIVYRVIDRVSASGAEYRLDWSTKLRGVVSTDFGSVTDRGVVFETSVAGRIRNFAGLNRVALIGGIRARVGSERLNDYFYEVPEAFVNSTRQAFDGRAGLIDIQTSIGIALRLPKRVRVFVAASTGFYEHSANRTSPLHRALRSTSTAIGIVWTIKQSESRVGILDTQ